MKYLIEKKNLTKNTVAFFPPQIATKKRYPNLTRSQSKKKLLILIMTIIVVIFLINSNSFE